MLFFHLAKFLALPSSIPLINFDLICFFGRFHTWYYKWYRQWHMQLAIVWREWWSLYHQSSFFKHLSHQLTLLVNFVSLVNALLFLVLLRQFPYYVLFVRKVNLLVDWLVIIELFNILRNCSSSSWSLSIFKSKEITAQAKSCMTSEANYQVWICDSVNCKE